MHRSGSILNGLANIVKHEYLSGKKLHGFFARNILTNVVDIGKFNAGLLKLMRALNRTRIF